MKLYKAILCLSLFLFLWNLSPTVAQPGSTQFINWETDGRNWVPLNTILAGPHGIIKFLPEGNSFEGWTELVTMQWYEKENISSRTFFEEFIGGLRSLWPNQLVYFNQISSSNLSLFGEWWTEGDYNNKPKYGLVRVFQLNSDIYALTYTTKDPELIPFAKNVWLPILKQATLNYADVEKSE